MNTLSNLLQQLHHKLQLEADDINGVHCLTISQSVAKEVALLPWLNAQKTFPQFFWQHRDNSEAIALCGEVCRFTTLAAAEQFLELHTGKPLRLWGLNAFDEATVEGESAQNSYLFLPRLSLSLSNNQLHVTLNLTREFNAENALNWLSQLAKAQHIEPLATQIISSQHRPDKVQWAQMIDRALQAFERGDMDKVVLARNTLLTLDAPLCAPAFMAASQQVNHHCFHFMMRFSADQAFMGSSPERLYLREGKDLHTEAIAGTVANDVDDVRAEQLGKWLLNDAKNRHENQFVVDDICQRLAVSVRNIAIEPARILRLRKVQHLCCPISATLSSSKDSACLYRLQPTAAVAGLPREQAKAFIAANEPIRRGWYAGSAGYLSLNRSEFCVALRSAYVQDNQVQLYAGAGMVAGSDAELEWQEIENKAAGLRTLLEGRI